MHNEEPHNEDTLSDTAPTYEDTSGERSTPQAGIPTVPQLIVALTILVLVLGGAYVYDIIQKRNASVEEVSERVPAVTSIQKEPTDHFADVLITANAAYVWDVKNQRALYNKNAGVQLPLASLTKLMTALVAYETLAGETAVRIPLDAIWEEGDDGLTSGQMFDTTSLIDLTLVSSSNDGAYALAAAAGSALDTHAATDTNTTTTFLELMNRRAEEIGLSQTYFANTTGLDVTTARSGSYGSARDMAFLMEYILMNQTPILEGTVNESLSIHDTIGTSIIATNTNQIASGIPGLIGSKTGYTELAGGNLVIAFDAGLNHPIIISVLGSTREERFSDVYTLVEAAQKTFISNE